jgi:hypothetical protein
MRQPVSGLTNLQALNDGPHPAGCGPSLYPPPLRMPTRYVAHTLGGKGVGRRVEQHGA